MKTRKIPMRKCAGCMESKPKSELIRIAGYEGEVSIDETGRAKGRGVYLCPNQNCLKEAQKKRAIGRSLHMNLKDSQLEKLFEELGEYEKKDR